MLWRQGPGHPTHARRDCYLWAQVVWPRSQRQHGMGTTPIPKSAERPELWAEVAVIQGDAGFLSTWEWGQEEGCGWFSGGHWWVWGLGTEEQGTEMGVGFGERQLGIRLGFCLIRKPTLLSWSVSIPYLLFPE